MTDPIIEASNSGWIAKHRELYLSDGAAGHLWDSTVAGGPGPLPTLLLTTIGRKSGKESIMPLLYGNVGNNFAIIASKGGDPRHPGWFHNLMVTGEAKIQVATEILQIQATVATGAERHAVWDQMAAMYPPFLDYQRRAAREIPVVLLKRK